MADPAYDALINVLPPNRHLALRRLMPLIREISNLEDVVKSITPAFAEELLRSAEEEYAIRERSRQLEDRQLERELECKKIADRQLERELERKKIELERTKIAEQATQREVGHARKMEKIQARHEAASDIARLKLTSKLLRALQVLQYVNTLGSGLATMIGLASVVPVLKSLASRNKESSSSS
eukprot:m51a1_g7223 hypothetical protein (183) ;mRNA; r:11091-11804